MQSIHLSPSMPKASIEVGYRFASWSNGV